jgi:hypothetical protein
MRRDFNNRILLLTLSGIMLTLGSWSLGANFYIFNTFGFGMLLVLLLTNTYLVSFLRQNPNQIYKIIPLLIIFSYFFLLLDFFNFVVFITSLTVMSIINLFRKLRDLQMHFYQNPFRFFFENYSIDRVFVVIVSMIAYGVVFYLNIHP